MLASINTVNKSQMKLSAAKHTKKKRPFVDTQELTITVKQEKNKIVGFDIRWKDKHKHFAVKKQNILAAWKEVEQFLAGI